MRNEGEDVKTLEQLGVQTEHQHLWGLTLDGEPGGLLLQSLGLGPLLHGSTEGRQLRPKYPPQSWL